MRCWAAQCRRANLATWGSWRPSRSPKTRGMVAQTMAAMAPAVWATATSTGSTLRQPHGMELTRVSRRSWPCTYTGCLSSTRVASCRPRAPLARAPVPDGKAPQLGRMALKAPSTFKSSLVFARIPSKALSPPQTQRGRRTRRTSTWRFRPAWRPGGACSRRSGVAGRLKVSLLYAGRRRKRSGIWTHTLTSPTRRPHNVCIAIGRMGFAGRSRGISTR
mmetsp:Transcript_76823/g.213442  ORF Transcript_76823/g.213442 Transcript_76823/m.213442 type:complete len:219 (+) Transcript_76823:127-783(+)